MLVTVFCALWFDVSFFVCAGTANEQAPNHQVPVDDGERDEEDRGQQHPRVHRGREVQQEADQGGG